MLFHAHGQMSDSLYNTTVITAIKNRLFAHIGGHAEGGVEKCQNFVNVFYSWPHIVCVPAKACGSHKVPLDVFSVSYSFRMTTTASMNTLQGGPIKTT